MLDAPVDSNKSGFSLTRSNTLLVAAAGLISAGLLYFGTGLHPIWWMVWLAPVPVLAIAPQLRGGVAFLLSSITWLIGQTNQWNYVRHYIELPVAIMVLFFVGPAVVFGFAVLFARRFLRRRSPFLAALGFTVFWVTWEYFNAILSPHSTWGNLAYTQMDFLPLVQIASITGLWGISFTVFLFAGAAGALSSGVGKPWQRRALTITVGFVVCAVVVFGEGRLRTISSGQRVAVTLIAKDVQMGVYRGSEAQALEVLRAYAEEIRRVTPAGTQVVVLPEKIGRVSENNLREVDAVFSSASLATHAAIDVGLVRTTASGSFNSSRFYSAEGQVMANYDKQHLVPGLEREQTGRHRVVLDALSRRWGLQICKDMDFPKLSREYASEGANLMLVPAWDFDLDRWLHARMAVLRAVENGFALARSAREGLLTLSDNRGRILAEVATVPDRFVSISGKVNVTREKTFYAWTGDWFAWVCVAMFVILRVIQLLTRSQTQKRYNVN
jgi:apolipoprotein N-acyltransferase